MKISEPAMLFALMTVATVVSCNPEHSIQENRARFIDVRELGNSLELPPGQATFKGYLHNHPKIMSGIYRDTDQRHPMVRGEPSVEILDWQFLDWSLSTPILVSVTGTYYPPESRGSYGALRNVQKIEFHTELGDPEGKESARVNAPQQAETLKP